MTAADFPADTAAHPADVRDDDDRAAVDAVLDDLLMNVVFDGWTAKSLSDALAMAADGGRVPPGIGERLFPNGVPDALDAFADWADRRMLDAVAMEAEAFADLKVRQKIAFLVRARLDALELHKEAVRRGVGVLALPHNARLGARLTWRTCDVMWRAAGDTATDANWYSKRVLLAGVWTSTLLYWLEDKSPGHEDTWGFLDRRIEAVLAVGKRLGAVKRLGDAAEAPFRLAARLRSRVAGGGAPGA